MKKTGAHCPPNERRFFYDVYGPDRTGKATANKAPPALPEEEEEEEEGMELGEDDNSEPGGGQSISSEKKARAPKGTVRPDDYHLGDGEELVIHHITIKKPIAEQHSCSKYGKMVQPHIRHDWEKEVSQTCLDLSGHVGLFDRHSSTLWDTGITCLDTTRYRFNMV